MNNLPNKILKLGGESHLKVAQRAGRFWFEPRNVKSVTESGWGKQLRSDSGGINALNHTRAGERRRKLGDAAPGRDWKGKNNLWTWFMWGFLSSVVAQAVPTLGRDGKRWAKSAMKGHCPAWWVGHRDTSQCCFRLFCPLLRVETRRQARLGTKVVPWRQI